MVTNTLMKKENLIVLFFFRLSIFPVNDDQEFSPVLDSHNNTLKEFILAKLHKNILIFNLIEYFKNLHEESQVKIKAHLICHFRINIISHLWIIINFCFHSPECRKLWRKKYQLPLIYKKLINPINFLSLRIYSLPLHYFFKFDSI